MPWAHDQAPNGLFDPAGMIDSFMKGLEVRRSRERAEAEQEDRKIQRELLRHKVKQMDIEDKIKAREEAEERLKALESISQTQSPSTFPRLDQSERDWTGVQDPVQVSSHQPVTLPATASAPEARIQPRSLQDVMRQKLLDRQNELKFKDDLEGIPLTQDIPELGYKAGQRPHREELSARTSLLNSQATREAAQVNRQGIDADRDASRAGMDDQRRFTREQAMKGDYDRVMKPYRESKLSIEKMKRAAQQATGAGDLTVLYQFIHEQDDTAAREGELELAKKFRSLGQRLEGYMKGATEGRPLDKKFIDDMVSQADSMSSYLDGKINQVRTNVRSRAKANKVDPMNILWDDDQGSGGNAGGQAGNTGAGKDQEYDAVFDPATRRFVRVPR